MKTITAANIQDKKVLIRIDTDVPIENGEVKDNTRIKAVMPTLELLRENARSVTILGHLGRPKGKVTAELDLEPVRKIIEQELRKTITPLQFNETPADTGWHILPNVRFDSREEENSTEFAQELAAHYDLFVFDAFAVAHRDSTSTTGITKYLPSYAGLRIAKEIEELSKVMHNPDHPFLAVIGGAKIETKLPTVEKLQSVADHVFVGGRLPHEIKEQSMTFPAHVQVAVMNESGLDISAQSTAQLVEQVKTAKLIVWNGPLGKFEDPSAQAGTKALCEALKTSTAYKVIGGGETINAVRIFNTESAINFVSVGGGAMLEFLSGKQLPALTKLI